MPFSTTSLTPLIQGGSFSLWHYRTTDSRATVAAAGYFATVAGSLRPGDLLVLQAADAMALLPIRVGPALGPGVTLDGAIGPINTVRSVAQGFSLRQTTSAAVLSIILAPFATAVVAGTSIPVSATVVGPIPQVSFTLRDGTGAVVPPARLVAVSAGQASTSFAAPPVGTGYRIRAENSADPTLGQTSRSFNVGPDLRLLMAENDGHLLTEADDILKQ